MGRPHDRFKNWDNGPVPGTEIERPLPRTSTRLQEQSRIPVLSIGASMSALTSLSKDKCQKTVIMGETD